MVQAQSRACIDFGKPYVHSIHCYCLAWRREGVLNLAWFPRGPPSYSFKLSFAYFPR